MKLSRIEAIVRAVPRDEARLIRLYYVSKHSQAEIAVQYGVSQGTISRRLDRAVKRVATLLRDE